MYIFIEKFKIIINTKTTKKKILINLTNLKNK